ncbi:MAG: STAS domain-containing protein [Gaiellales bacterium]
MAVPVQFAVHGPIAREDLPGLCDRVCRVLAENAAVELLCDVRSVAPDAVTVDALARLQLAAHRNGRKVRLQNASPQLLELVEFMALDDVLRA